MILKYENVLNSSISAASFFNKQFRFPCAANSGRDDVHIGPFHFDRMEILTYIIWVWTYDCCHGHMITVIST